MNYLLLGGNNTDFKREVVRIYAERLDKSADFDLIRGNVPEAVSAPVDVVFNNRITSRTVFINTKGISVGFLQQLLHFKDNFSNESTIMIGYDAGDTPDKTLLKEQMGFDEKTDNVMEISVEEFPGADMENVKKITDELEAFLSVKPYNLL